MIKLAITLASILYAVNPATVAVNPPTWQLTMPEKAIKAGDEFTITLTTEDIPDGWYVYSNDFDFEDGPIKADITFENSSEFTPVGELTAVNSTKHFDDVWEAEIAIFETGKATFTHKLKANKANPQVKGTISYQMCNSNTGMCVLFDSEFSSTVTKQ